MKSCYNCKFSMVCPIIRDVIQNVKEWMQDIERDEPKLEELLNDNDRLNDYLHDAEPLIIGLWRLTEGLAEFCKNYKKAEGTSFTLDEFLFQYRKELELHLKHRIEQEL